MKWARMSQDDVLVSAFEMLVEEIGTFDKKVSSALTKLHVLNDQQKGYISNSIAQTKALLCHFGTRKGVLAGCLTGLPFDIEKSFAGEASYALAGSLYVKDRDADNRLLDAVIRATESGILRPFGKFTEAMCACFSSGQVSTMHDAFLKLKGREEDGYLLGSNLMCATMGIQDSSCEKLGREMIFRFVEHKYMYATYKLLCQTDETSESVRAFRAIYDCTWKNAWFVPVMKWAARDIFCCMHVFVSTENPLTAIDFAKFVECVTTGIMNVPPELVFRFREYSLGPTTSACPEATEVSSGKEKRHSMTRLCGLMARAFNRVINSGPTR